MNNYNINNFRGYNYHKSHHIEEATKEESRKMMWAGIMFALAIILSIAIH